MTLQAEQPHGPATSSRTSDYVDRSRAIERARRHSKRVSILRIALPLTALAIASLYFISSGVTVNVGDMQASVSRIEINKDRLRMVDPKLEGVTDDAGNYLVTADYAEQEVSNPSLVHLNAVRAEVNNKARGWTRLTSPKGLFDTKAEALALMGDIRVTSNSGLTSYLTRADIDMKSQLVTSNEPVKVIFPNGHLDSHTMRINMQAREIAFEGDVKVRTKPAPKKDQPAKTGEDAAAGQGSALAASFDRDKPIDILAPKLTIFDKEKFAHFTDGVVTSQGGSRMLSRELKIHYSGGGEQKDPPKEAEQGQAMSGKLNRIEATGDVRITTDDGRSASGAILVYDAVSRQLLIDQDVTLTQGNSVLKGPRMVADLASSVTRFPPGGRVHGHFVPKPEDAAKQAVKKAAQPLKAVELGSSRLDLSSSRGKPVDVEADTLTVYDARKQAVFEGNVHTRQGGMSLRSRELRVSYGGAKGADGKGSAISQVRADGSVLITTDKDQTVTSKWALFESSDQTITIGGDVVLTQQENVIKGERLVIDLKTGQSRFVDQGNVATNGRVRMLFTPKKDAKRNGAQPAGN